MHAPGIDSGARMCVKSSVDCGLEADYACSYLGFVLDVAMCDRKSIAAGGREWL